jgi:uncharacterized protein YodC (DUF2158 family)
MHRDEIKKGQVVRLASGGPQMTVEDYDYSSWSVDCVWFQDGAIKRASFNSKLLQPV